MILGTHNSATGGELLVGGYFIGKYDPIFVANKRIEYYERMIRMMRRRIEEYKNKRLIV